MSVGSSTYRQLQNFLAGTNQYYPLYMPGAKTFFVAPSTYVAVDGLTPNNGNDGETPQEPLLTIAAAHAKAVSGRGDTIVLMPGTYVLTSPVALTKIGVRLVAMKPYSANVTGDGVVTNLIAVDGNDIEIAGLRIAGVAAAVVLVDVANTSSIGNFHIHHCKFIGLETVASVEGILNGELISGNACLQSLIEDNYFEGLSQSCITTFGGGTVIKNNIFNMDDTASHTAIAIGDQGAAFATVKNLSIINNVFCGYTNNSALLAITMLGSEANTQMYCINGNAFANVGSASVNGVITQDIHPEGVVANWLGQATTVTPLLVEG